MRTIYYSTRTFEIRETRSYIVQGSGTSDFEAEQDAIERFYRLSKSGEMIPNNISKPRGAKQLE